MLIESVSNLQCVEGKDVSLKCNGAFPDAPVVKLKLCGVYHAKLMFAVEVQANICLIYRVN